MLRVALAANGSSYAGTVRPFLTGLKNPVPVILSSRGAILVGDWSTGTIYSIVKV